MRLHGRGHGPLSHPYIFVVMEVGSRPILHCNLTEPDCRMDDATITRSNTKLPPRAFVSLLALRHTGNDAEQQPGRGAPCS
jgi:hypothetical protein